jgi:hypothetical protein
MCSVKTVFKDLDVSLYAVFWVLSLEKYTGGTYEPKQQAGISSQ